MSQALFKVLIGATSVSFIGGASVTTSYMLSGESIRAYIERTKKSKNKVFLTSATPKLIEIQAKYKTSTRTKPKKDNVDVADTKLGEWCEVAVKEKFSDENNSTYKGIISWCYINTNDFKEELNSDKKDIVSAQDEGHQDWKDAWGKYKLDRNNEKLKIVETTYDDLNKEVEEAAGKAMAKWCKAIYDGNKKLYEDGVEKDYERFIRWCSKNKE